MFNGKKLSILGDSLSSYHGITDAICENSYYYSRLFIYKDPFPLEDTYWGRLIKSLGFTLCVNNSLSGGNLSGKDDPDSGVNRSLFLAKEDGDTPDFIIVFMGINDLGRGIDPEIFASDYELTLSRIKENYPVAKVCCVNIPDRDIFLKKSAELFNTKISEAVKKAGKNFFVADLFSSRLNNDFYYDNTIDGLHPDRDGMRYIAEVVEKAFLDNVC